MRDLADIAALLSQDEPACRLLAHVERLDLPDCWIGAGFVRNAVWDVLHGAATTPLNDIDVIFFDPDNTSRESEVAIEQSLRAQAPGPGWSVKNQARMHLRNGDAPYRDTADAMSHWGETPTAIAARSVDGRIELNAPFGVADLLGLVVRPTPHFATKMEMYLEQLREKNWASHWPGLRLVEAVETDVTAP